MADDEEKKRKQAETERKRAEVRARLEEASKAKKAKKGFMTPDRKKKLRLLLRKKAAEELKKEQERKAAERRRIIEERCGKMKDVENVSEESLKKILRDYYNRICGLEDKKFDVEYIVKKKDYEVVKKNHELTTSKKLEKEKFEKKQQQKLIHKIKERERFAVSLRHRAVSSTSDICKPELQTLCTGFWNRIYALEGDKFDLERKNRLKDMEISELNSQVNDLRGKFMKPTLKKVSKYENKFAKLQKKAAEFNFRNQLKQVKKKEFTLEEEDKEKKPDWSKKGEEKKVKEEEVEA